jgi:hypothetical protein
MYSLLSNNMCKNSALRQFNQHFKHGFFCEKSLREAFIVLTFYVWTFLVQEYWRKWNHKIFWSWPLVVSVFFLPKYCHCKIGFSYVNIPPSTKKLGKHFLMKVSKNVVNKRKQGKVVEVCCFHFLGEGWLFDHTPPINNIQFSLRRIKEAFSINARLDLNCLLSYFTCTYVKGFV